MRYGATYAKWAPFSGDEPTDGTMPTYGTALDFGCINESNDTINFAEASAYGDNLQKIVIKEFSNGTIATKTVDNPIACGAAIMGNAYSESTGIRLYDSDDNQPFGGYGFICNKMDANKNRFSEVVFYPKVQGSPEGSNYKTKEDGVTLEYDAVSFNLFACNAKHYKIVGKCATETAAKTMLDALFAGTQELPTASGSTTTVS